MGHWPRCSDALFAECGEQGELMLFGHYRRRAWPGREETRTYAAHDCGEKKAYIGEHRFMIVVLSR
jgi:hypothetical protein